MSQSRSHPDRNHLVVDEPTLTLSDLTLEEKKKEVAELVRDHGEQIFNHWRLKHA